jgi:solute carrier family 25 phosphate transporter 23/24/25/41
MSEPNEQKLKSVFESLDINNDGYLTIDELEIGMRALGVAPPSKEACRGLFKHIDSNEDGKIQLAEFRQFYFQRRKELRAVFDKLDANYDGKITSAEVAAAIERVNLKASSNQLRAIMAKLDLNNSGRISFDEFLSSLLLIPSLNPEAIFESFLVKTPLEVAQGEYNLPKENPKELADSPKSKEKSVWTEISHQLYYGGVAGITSRTATAPIDRLKVSLMAISYRMHIKNSIFIIMFKSHIFKQYTPISMLLCIFQGNSTSGCSRFQ